MSDPTYYETMYILRPDIPEDEVEGHLKKYSEVLEKAKAKIIDNQMRGKRRLAYTIGKHKEGIYVQLSHTGNGKHVETLERSMRLSEDVIRYLTVKQYGPLPTKRNTKSQDKEASTTNNENDTKEVKEAKDTKEVKEAKDTKEVKEAKDTKEVKEAKDTKEVKEAKDTKEVKEEG
ncbi:ribosomal protein S6 [Prochlorococcus marinus str. SS2]|nr:30S ribosomal protein S6 [Prochlorococcus marinus]KGG19947.1 ribosomal protein S6 [Prochlorococcus marinus str. SS2]